MPVKDAQLDGKHADFLKAVITQFVEKGQTLDFARLASDAGLLNARAANYRWSKLKSELNIKGKGNSIGKGEGGFSQESPAKKQGVGKKRENDDEIADAPAVKKPRLKEEVKVEEFLEGIELYEDLFQ
jgi:hypothetical protein